MLITVAGKQVETGEALKTHVSDGLTAITAKYFDHALEANVTFHKHRSQFSCDINLKAGRGLMMRAEGEGADAHRAFEVAAEHLAKRMRRYRRRVNEHARSFAGERDAPVEEAPRGTRYVIEAPADEEAPEQGDHGAIIAENPTHIEKLSVGEAVMRLDLAQAQVVMFRNRKGGGLNVVYRRADGNIGWIDPGEG